MKRLRPYLLVAPLVLLLWGYVVRPLVATFTLSLEGGIQHYLAFLAPGYNSNLQALATSLYISLLSTLFAGVVGVALASLLHHYEFPGRRLLKVFALVPLALPPLIGVYAFTFLFDETGMIPRGLQALLNLPRVPFALRGVAGVLVVHTFTMYPYFYSTAAAAFAGFDPSVEEAAYNLGAKRWQVWWRVRLPLLTPALVSGSLLVFMVSMASYTAPLIFGVERTMTMQITIARTNGNLALASTQATVLSLVATCFLLFMRWYQARRSYQSSAKGVSSHRSEVRNPWGRRLTMVASFLLVFVLLLPVLTIVLISFAKDGSWTTQVLPPTYTWQNYVRLFTQTRTFAPIRNSLQMSGLAALLSIGVGTFAAYALQRLNFKGKALLDLAVMLPWALPGTVVAINLIAAFNEPTVFGFGQVLVGTFWIVPLVYFVRFMPLVFRSSSASLAQLDPSLEEAARGLGAGWWYAFFRVTLPLLARGILAGALLAFVQGVGEFVASVLVYTSSTRPISVEIYNKMYQFEFGTAAAYGTLQIGLILLVLAINSRLERGATTYELT